MADKATGTADRVHRCGKNLVDTYRLSIRGRSSSIIHATSKSDGHIFDSFAFYSSHPSRHPTSLLYIIINISHFPSQKIENIDFKNKQKIINYETDPHDRGRDVPVGLAQIKRNEKELKGELSQLFNS